MIERPDKVEPVPFKELSDPIDQLDAILGIVCDSDESLSFDEIRYQLKYKRLRVSDRDLQIAVDKLLLDKHISSIGKTDTGDGAFYITHHGRLFFQDVSMKFNNKPYRHSVAIHRRDEIYAKVKIGANIANTLAILFIGIWGVCVTNRTNQLEEKMDKSELKYRQQIDSLTRIIGDTIRVK